MSAAGSNPAPSAPSGASSFHLNHPSAAIGFGLSAIAGGAAVICAVVLRAVGPPAATRVALGIAAVSAAAAVFALARLGRRAPVLVLDEAGYRLFGVRGVGVRAATWREVADVASSGSGASQVVQVRLRDGRCTTLPARLIDEPTSLWLTDLRSRLDRVHGGAGWWKG